MGCLRLVSSGLSRGVWVGVVLSSPARGLLVAALGGRVLAEVDSLAVFLSVWSGFLLCVDWGGWGWWGALLGPEGSSVSSRGGGGLVFLCGPLLSSPWLVVVVAGSRSLFENYTVDASIFVVCS